MIKNLDSNTIIEMFAHPAMVGQNVLGIFLIPVERSSKHPPAWLLISNDGIQNIKQVIEDVKNRNVSVDAPGTASTPKQTDLADEAPRDHSTFYYEITAGSERLGFGIVLPADYAIDIPEKDVLPTFSRIIEAVKFSHGAWS